MLQAERPLIMHASLRFQPRTAPAAAAAAVIRKRRFSLFFGHFACLDDNTQNQQQQQQQQWQQLVATTTGNNWQQVAAAAAAAVVAAPKWHIMSEAPMSVNWIESLHIFHAHKGSRRSWRRNVFAACVEQRLLTWH